MKGTMIGFRIKKDLMAEVKRICDLNHIRMGSLTQELLADWLKEVKEGKKEYKT